MIRVRVARAQGSTPREDGAEMFVGADAVTGSVGGGRLEAMAIDEARAMLRDGRALARMDVALGPEIGQCCGGRVELAFDRAAPSPRAPREPVLIFGAGHVGRALARALAPTPVAPCLVESRADELALAPDDAERVLTALPEGVVRAAPPGAAFVVTTHDHALDFLIATQALKRGDAAYVGMIGSATKRALFERHAREQGVSSDALVCPLAAGAPRDKRPEVIAAFAAAEILAAMLASARRAATLKDDTA